jgi:intracellular septation protein
LAFFFFAQTMKILLDFLPLLLFFVAYKLGGIYVGTAVLMAATAAQMACVYWLDKRLSAMHKATLGLILVFGALTLILQDERFIKWKPSVLYFAMAVALGVALWGMGKNLLKLMLGSQLDLPDPVWQRLSIAWMCYCAFMAALNGYVAAFYSTDAWADFKIWGYVFPLAFILGQGVYVARHLRDDDAPAAADAAADAALPESSAIPAAATDAARAAPPAQAES